MAKFKVTFDPKTGFKSTKVPNQLKDKGFAFSFEVGWVIESGRKRRRRSAGKTSQKRSSKSSKKR